MPASTPTFAWQHAINMQTAHGGDTATRNRTALYELVRAMLGLQTTYDDAGSTVSMSAPFVVVASSGFVTGTGAANNWASVADVIFEDAGTAHAWMHLRLVDYFESGVHLNLLIDCIPNQTTEAIGRISWARGALGFNLDGTSTDRPTVESGVTEIILRDGVATGGDAQSSDQLWGPDATTEDIVVHFQISEDGQAGRWFAFVDSAVVAVFGWQRDELGPGRTNDFFVWAACNDSTDDVWQWATELNTLDLFRSLTDAGVEFGAYASGTVFSSAETPIQDINLSGFSTRRMMVQVLLGTPTGTVGPHSILTDLWWGRAADANGEGGPTADPRFRKLGEMVTPWPAGQTMIVT